MSTAWDTYAETRPQRPVTNRTGQFTWWNWTQYPDHGPGTELLGQPQNVLDLGCGDGRNIAHLVSNGATGIGVDIAGLQVERARKRWSPAYYNELTFAHADAVDYLLRSEERFDAITSVFGAVWFTDPTVLLPLIVDHLTPGGVFAFSHEPPIQGCYGCQGSYIRPKGTGPPRVVRRWAYDGPMWFNILIRAGFVHITTDIIDAPDSDGVGTLLVRAERPA
ncbi:class I SAM-dependent methyltransferase [Streptomyces boluensis]|nr:class I SAM-dependent methyltransferase [Streptomyces boluensis]